VEECFEMPFGDAELSPELYLCGVTSRSCSFVAENSCLLRLISSRHHSSELLNPEDDDIRCNETSVAIYQSTWRNVPEHLHRYACILFSVFPSECFGCSEWTQKALILHLQVQKVPGPTIRAYLKQKQNYCLCCDSDGQQIIVRADILPNEEGFSVS
jgi:hypothetical protein